MEKYDVILVIFSLVAFVISICRITARFTGAISRLEVTVEQFGTALTELKSTIVTLREDNKKAHGEIYGKLEHLDRRVLYLEAMEGGKHENTE